jgi:hypothetical protein
MIFRHNAGEWRKCKECVETALDGAALMVTTDIAAKGGTNAMRSCKSFFSLRVKVVSDDDISQSLKLSL